MGAEDPQGDLGHFGRLSSTTGHYGRLGGTVGGYGMCSWLESQDEARQDTMARWLRTTALEDL